MAALGGYRAEAGQPAVDLIAPSFYSPPPSSCGKSSFILLTPYLSRIFGPVSSKSNLPPAGWK